MFGNCSVGLFLAILISVFAASIILSGVAAIAYGFMRKTLQEYGPYMPFRAAEARILNWLVVFSMGGQFYYAVSIAMQVSAGRPVCTPQWNGWTYYLSWSDWVMFLFLVMWPGVCQLVLLYTANQSVEDVRMGRPQRKPGWLPDAFLHPSDKEILQRLEDIRAEVQDGSTEENETLLGRIEEIKAATIKEAREMRREVREDHSEALEEMKETVEEAVEEATNGIQAHNEKDQKRF